jgi:chromosome segregation ATPase
MNPDITTDIKNLMRRNHDMQDNINIVITNYIQKINELETAINKSHVIIQDLKNNVNEQKQETDKYKNLYNQIVEKGKDIEQSLKDLKSKHETLQLANERLIALNQKHQQEIHQKDIEIETLKSTKASLATISQQYHEKNDQYQKLFLEKELLRKDSEILKSNIEREEKLKQSHTNEIEKLNKRIEEMKTSYDNAIKLVHAEQEAKYAKLKQEYDSKVSAQNNTIKQFRQALLIENK